MSKKSDTRQKDESLQIDRDTWIAKAVLAAARKVVTTHGDDDKAIGVIKGREKSRFV